jgi:hypothetical protein
MVFRAKLRRLEFETRQGKLVEAEDVKTRWASILVELKERPLLQLPLLLVVRQQPKRLQPAKPSANRSR